MEIPLFQDIVVIFAFSAVVILIFHRLKIPPIVGFLVTGILIGPAGILNYYSGLDIIDNSNHEINHLAEIGVMLLLFTIGIEFSIKNLIQIRRTVLLGGSIQVGLSIAITYVIASLSGYSFGEAIFMGFLVALSSTAIVLRTLQKDGQISLPSGKASLGILIFQDVIIVPMMLFIPILAGNAGNIGLSILILVGKTVLLIIFTYVLSKWLIPKLLHQVAKTGSRELFLLTLLVVGFTVAWLTSFMGLSLALGAFLAGLAISESEYSHHAFGNVVPFRDIFTAFFFVSIGMLLDFKFILSEPLSVLIFAILVLTIKTFVSGFATFILGYPLRTTVVVGLSLSQIGEFSFVLAAIGLKNGFLLSESGGENYYYQLFLAVTTVTMILTPFIIMLSPWISDTILKILPIPDKYIKGLKQIESKQIENLENHLIIVGMGLNGSNLARAAKTTNIKYEIIESDAEIVREKQNEGEPIMYGDACYESVLEQAGIKKAQVLVTVIGDPASTYTIIRNARLINPEIYIIARTRYMEDVDDLYKAGANDVIPEEFETSLEIFSRVLNKYLIPKSEIDEMVASYRYHGYQNLREFDIHSEKRLNDLKLNIPDVEISAVTIKENSELLNKTIEESDIRKRHGISILAIRRNNQTITNPTKDEVITTGDVLYIMGDYKKCNCAASIISGDGDKECDIPEVAK
ncbi:MAG: cation:proton antiporter [Saprospiraceae bacterium]|nr:cation:proton antiporter [Saprospiraceae bacterium]